MYKVGDWDTAISEAERLIRECRFAAAKLRASVKHFRRMKESGELFPGQRSSATAK